MMQQLLSKQSSCAAHCPRNTVGGSRVLPLLSKRLQHPAVSRRPTVEQQAADRGSYVLVQAAAREDELPDEDEEGEAEEVDDAAAEFADPPYDGILLLLLGWARCCCCVYSCCPA